MPQSAPKPPNAALRMITLNAKKATPCRKLELISSPGLVALGASTIGAFSIKGQTAVSTDTESCRLHHLDL
jgi:hypothetical protein